MQSLRKRLNYANVMSTIAVVLALGGATAFAASQLAKNSVGTKQLKANAVTGEKVKDGSLTGNDVDASTLGEVPKARAAATASTAAHADTATQATSVAAPEAERFVGEGGAIPFGEGWQAAAGRSVSFYKDREGVVHLSGLVERVAPPNFTIFVLPPGYAPREQQFIATATVLAPGSVVVEASGAVKFGSGSVSSFSLSGVSWRAAG